LFSNLGSDDLEFLSAAGTMLHKSREKIVIESAAGVEALDDGMGEFRPAGISTREVLRKVPGLRIEFDHAAQLVYLERLGEELSQIFQSRES